jgi:F-type H+-transporting ATPase subunit gamma
MFSSPVGYGTRHLAAACKRVSTPTPQGARNMATLKDIKLRIKSVTSISKLTKTMQMVASSKLRAATRKVADTKESGSSIHKIFEDKDITPLPEAQAGPSLIVTITSDKGMCGPVNNQLVRHAKSILRAETNSKSGIVTLGSKGTPTLVNEFPGQFQYSLKDFGKKEPSFIETGFVVDQLLASSDYEYINVLFNRFKNALTYLVTEIPIYGPKTLLANRSQFVKYEFDEDEDATFRDLFEYQLATTIWSGLIESRASELAARMTSMDNATKNATSIISLLAIQYNRGRQSAITTELIEITSGASALEEDGSA